MATSGCLGEVFFSRTFKRKLRIEELGFCDDQVTPKKIIWLT